MAAIPCDTKLDSSLALVETAVRCPAAAECEVPEQDLTVPVSRMPTLPRSRFRMRMGAAK